MANVNPAEEIHWREVQSTSVHSLVWVYTHHADREELGKELIAFGTLMVRYMQGQAMIYMYPGVSFDAYNKLKEADSVGKAMYAIKAQCKDCFKLEVG